MAILVFVVNAVAVYLLGDWIVRIIEHRRGAPLKYRSLVFLAVFVVLILVTFEAIQLLFDRSAQAAV